MFLLKLGDLWSFLKDVKKYNWATRRSIIGLSIGPHQSPENLYDEDTLRKALTIMP